MAHFLVNRSHAEFQSFRGYRFGRMQGSNCSALVRASRDNTRRSTTMPQLTLIASVLSSGAVNVLSILVNSLRDVRRYRPERHYMRGPGPKWREKHSSHRG